MKAFRLLCVVAVALLNSSCALEWPKSSGNTYAGQVVHFSLITPIPGATVTISRPKCQTFLWPMVEDEEIGHAKTDSQGHFRLTTSAGFARDMVVSTKDGRMSALVQLDRGNHEKMLIKVTPGVSGVTTRPSTNPEVYVDVESASSKAARAAIESIIIDIASHPGRPLKSLSQYASAGVITQDQLHVFSSSPRFYFGAHPLVRYDWSRQYFRISGIDRPIQLIQRSSSMPWED